MIKVPFWGLLIILTLSSAVEAESLYHCKTEFGQTIPIRSVVLKPGAACTGCDQPGQAVPHDIVDYEYSLEWNPRLEGLPGLKSKTKRRSFFQDNRKIFLDTRYAVKPGPSFQFRLQCPKDPALSTKCAGEFIQDKPLQRLSLATEVFDRRLSDQHGRAEITLGNREHLGWIVRLFRDAVPDGRGGAIGLSGSSELKFLHEDSIFIFDLGVDEQLYLLDGLRARLAALEVKIRCQQRSKI